MRKKVFLACCTICIFLVGGLYFSLTSQNNIQEVAMVQNMQSTLQNGVLQDVCIVKVEKTFLSIIICENGRVYPSAVTLAKNQEDLVRNIAPGQIVTITYSGPIRESMPPVYLDLSSIQVTAITSELLFKNLQQDAGRFGLDEPTSGTYFTSAESLPRE